MGRYKEKGNEDEQSVLKKFFGQNIHVIRIYVYVVATTIRTWSISDNVNISIHIIYDN